MTITSSADGPVHSTPQDDFSLQQDGGARRAVNGALWSLLNAFMPAATGMVVFTLASRALSAGEFGLVALATGIGSIASALSPAGLGEGIVQRSTIGREHLDSAFWACLASGAVLYAILVGGAGGVAAALDEALLLPLIVVLGSRIVFDALAVVPNALLIRKMAFRQLAIRTGVASFLSAVVCLGLLWIGAGLWALALSQLATAISLSIGAIVAARWVPRVYFSMPALRQLMRFGFFASAVRAMGIANIDQVLVGTLLGPAALGLYSFSRRIFQLLSDLIAGALGNVSFSLLSSVQSDRSKRREIFQFATFISATVSFPIFVGLAVIASDLVPMIFGDHWVEAVKALQAFCMLGLITSVGVLQSSLIRSHGQMDMWFYHMLAKQLGTVFYIVLFHSWGVAELVWALVIMQYVMWFPAIHMVLRILDVSLFAYLRHFLAPAAATLFMVGMLHCMNDMLPVDGWIRLAALVAGGGLCYAIAIAILAGPRLRRLVGVVTRRERY